MKCRVSLYIAGDAPNGLRARKNVTELCERLLKDDVELRVVDIIETPEMAYAHQIIAAPVLVREHPPPVRKILGDLSDKEQVLRFLTLSQEAEHARA